VTPVWRVTLAAGLALATKAAFSGASVEALRWLLAPTASLTALATGHAFSWEAGVGYVSTTAKFAIVPACAGVTFFSVALGLLLIHGLPRPQRVLLAVVGAYGATVLANTVRLVGCVWLHVDHWRLGALSEAELHRLIGLAVYTSALVMLALAVGDGSRRAVALTLGWYLAVTLGVPLVHGTAGPGYGAHALWTLLVVVPVGGLALLLKGRPGERGLSDAAGLRRPSALPLRASGI
jgi:exosortase K